MTALLAHATIFFRWALALGKAALPTSDLEWMQLARQNKYKETVFHRLIPGFMIQGGGLDGTSIWGKNFEDEYGLRNACGYSGRSLNVGTLSNLALTRQACRTGNPFNGQLGT